MKRRVVITGLGAVTPLGVGVEKSWQSLCQGKSGIDRVTRFDATDFRTQIAGEVKDFFPEDFMEKNMSLFKKRMSESRVRDCHGDIHSGNIFFTDEIYIFDAIEFNERFRYSDVAADVAFLAMDLDFKKRTDLSHFFVRKYVEYSGDQELTKLLPFYKCYRACVRGKVISFKLNDANISKREKSAAIKEACSYFKLASTYAKMFN